MPNRKMGLTAVIGLSAIAALCLLAGENPFTVIKILIMSSLAQPEDMAVTLFHATHLMFSAAGLCIAFQAGLFPIGAEGQLSAACLATTIVGLILPPTFLSVMIALLAGVAVSVVLGLILSYFKNRKGAHEVIVSMMLNFLVAGLANYLISHFFQSTVSQNPESATIPTAYWIFKPLVATEGAPVNTTFFIAISVCVLAWLLIERTRFGFELRTVGKSPSVALNSGMSVRRVFTWAFAIAAGLAGLGAWNQILGYAHKYQIGFSADYGFLAIAVALMARNNPLAVIPNSIFFAILLKGSADLDIETDFITRDFVKVIQAALILTFLVIQRQRADQKAGPQRA